MGFEFGGEEGPEGAVDLGWVRGDVGLEGEGEGQVEAVEEGFEEFGFESSDGHVASIFALVDVVPWTSSIKQVVASGLIP